MPSGQAAGQFCGLRGHGFTFPVAQGVHHASREYLSGLRKPAPASILRALALVHGYTTAFWWSAAIFACGAVVAAVLFRRGPLTRPGAPGQPGAVPEGSRQAVAPPA
jgi:hypothetical protein